MRFTLGWGGDKICVIDDSKAQNKEFNQMIKTDAMERYFFKWLAKVLLADQHLNT